MTCNLDMFKMLFVKRCSMIIVVDFTVKLMIFITWMNCWNRIVGQVLLDQQLEYEFEISG